MIFNDFQLKLEENQLEELLNVADCNYRKYEKELREKEENLSKYRSEVENADIKSNNLSNSFSHIFEFGYCSQKSI